MKPKFATRLAAVLSLWLALAAPLLCQDSYEVDDTPTQARVLVNGAAQNRSIHTIGDVDWCQFTLTAPSWLRLETDGFAGDTEMWLFGPNSSTAQVAYSDDDGNGAFSLITRTDSTILSPGTYYVKIGGYKNGSTIASYTVRADWGQSRLSQTIAWSSPAAGSFLLVNQPQPLAATASSGLPVSFRVQSGPAAIAEGMVTATNVGTIVLVAEQAGDDTFAPASLSRRLNQSSVALSLQGKWPEIPRGAALDVFLKDSRAYVAIGAGGLAIFDVGDPANPVRLGGYDTTGKALTVQVVGTVAYVADSWAGLQVLDVSNSANPVRLGAYDTSDWAYAVQVVGNFAYVADGFDGLQVLDVSNPANPVRLGGYDTTGRALAVQVVGNLAYVADYDSGLQVLDVSNPANPVRLGGYDTAGYAHAVQVVGNLAYVADRDAGLQVLDVSDPANPVRLGGYDTSDYALAVQVVGSLAYVADGNAGLQVLDVSDPANPVRLGGYDTSGYANRMQVVGNFAYVADDEWGLQVLRLQEGLAQSLSFDPPAQLLVTNAPLTLSATASSGLPVSVSLVSGPATLADGQLTLTGAGTVVVRAEQPGNAQFLPVSLERSIIISKVPQNLAWTSPAAGSVLLLNQPQRLAATASSGLPVSFRVQSGPAVIAEGMVTATNVGTIVLVAEQAGDDTFAPVSLSRRVNQSSVATTLVGSWPGFRRGQAFDVEVVGNLAYVTLESGGIGIFDVSNPAKPSPLGGYNCDDEANDIQIVENLAYVANNNQGLLILDISNPAAVVRVGGYDTAGFAEALQVVGNLAYVADGDRGLQVLDVGSPSSVNLVGSFDTSGIARGVQVVGNLAYIADDSAGLLIVDVTNPANPVRVGGFYTSGAAGGVRVSGNWAYVADGEAGLRVLEVSNPASPVLRGSFDTSGYALSVQVVGNLAYVADDASGLQVLDVSNPANPVRLGGYDTAGNANAVQVVGNLAYVADGSDFRADGAGLKVLDVSNPASVVRLGGYNTGGAAGNVQVVGNVAYLAEESAGITLIDVSNPADPQFLGSYDTQGHAFEVAVAGTHAYVADGYSGLQVIDVSNPTNPQFVANRASGDASGIAASGGYVYVVDSERGLVDVGLKIFDVDDPNSPSRVGAYIERGIARSVFVADNLAYVSEKFGLGIFDVSSPVAPKRVGGVATEDDVSDVYVMGKYAYLAIGDSTPWVGNGRLQIVDVSDSGDPVLVGNYLTAENANGVQVVGNLAYVAIGSAGLQVFDVSIPSAPLPVGGYDTSGFAEAVQVVGDLAYVADAEAGLQILRLRDGIAQTLTFEPSAAIFAVDSPIQLTATASSGLPVSFSVVSGPATVAGNQLTLTGLGTVAVRAEQAGNVQFLPVSVERRITVLSGAPVLTRLPGSGAALRGAAFSLSVEASGAAPFSYRWFRNGQIIRDATGATLNLNAVTLADAGDYTVEVRNAVGSAISQPAQLTVMTTPFQAPRIWERFTTNSFSTGPDRIVHDGKGGVYLCFQLLDWISGKQAGVPIKIREADGTLDPSFQPGPLAFQVHAVAAQPDGRVLVAGNGDRSAFIVRLLADGGLDPSFRPFELDMGVRFLMPLSDGKVLATVWNSSFSPTPEAYHVESPTVLRLHPDGRLDDTFTAPAFVGFSSLYTPPLMDAQGRIYLGGSFRISGHTNLVRLLSNGPVDPTFIGASSLPNSLRGVIRGLGFQSDGRLIAVGDIRMPANASAANRLVALRFDADGRFDSSFSEQRQGDLALGDYPRMMIMQPDDKFVVAAAGLHRFNPDGTLDPTFRRYWPGGGYENFGVSQAADGRLFTRGDAEHGLVAFDKDGNPDPGVNVQGFGATVAPTSFALAGGDRVAVAGSFNRLDTAVRPVLAMLDRSTGAPFSAQPDPLAILGEPVVSPTFYGESHQVFEADGGKLYYVGTASRPGDFGLETFPFAKRLRADGSVDDSFEVAPAILAGSPRFIADSARQLWFFRSGEQAAVDWWFNTTGGRAPTNWFWFSRLAADGSLTPDFQGAPPPEVAELFNQVSRVVTEPDGSLQSITVGGIRPLTARRQGGLIVAVTTTEGVQRLVKLSSSGLIEPAFSPPVVSGASSIQHLQPVFNPVTGTLSQPTDGVLFFESTIFRHAAELPDGSVLVAGGFSELGGVAAPGLARLRPDGSVQPSALPVLTLSDSPFASDRPRVFGLTTDSAGRAYVAGIFDHVNGIPTKGIIRLNADGSWDQSFVSPLELVDYPAATAQLQLDGDILWVGGSFRRIGESFPRPLWRISLSVPDLLAGPTSGSVVGGGVITAVASGAGPLTYRWYRDGHEVSGATGATMSVADAGSYAVEVSNSFGRVLSEPAVLTVVEPPRVLEQLSPRVLVAGEAVAIPAGIGGLQLSRQWFRDGAPLTGQTGENLVFNPVTLADAGAYSVVATNLAGAVTNGPASFRVEVNLAPPLVALPPPGADGKLTLEVIAAAGEEVIVETTTDLKQWDEAQRVTGQGRGTPVRVAISPQAGPEARFWRVRRL